MPQKTTEGIVPTMLGPEEIMERDFPPTLLPNGELPAENAITPMAAEPSKPSKESKKSKDEESEVSSGVDMPGMYTFAQVRNKKRHKTIS